MPNADQYDSPSASQPDDAVSGSSSSPIKLFISYAHKDEDMRRELDVHLSNLQRQKMISSWHDRLIEPGRKWADQIHTALDDARIILLLISADFLASDYCYAKEMNRALERHEAGEAVVIPIILRAVDWEGAPFSELQALPKDARPIKKWKDRDEAWVHVVQGLRRVIETLNAPTPFRVSVQPAARIRKPHQEHQSLPYLCNRSEQEMDLKKALRQHRDNRARRPVLCVIHGDEYECHDKFIERLRTETLPELLGLKVAIEECYWNDPPPPQSTADDFWLSLGDRILAPSPNSVEECRERILKKLAASESPLFINLGWLTDDCERGGAELFSSFLQFWEEWPDLPANKLVIGGLSLTYLRSKESTSRFSFWQKSPNERLRQLVTQLKPRNSDKLTLAVLTELRAITRKEAEDWPNHPKVRSQYQVPKQVITELYRQINNQPISMEKLAAKLKELLSAES